MSRYYLGGWWQCARKYRMTLAGKNLTAKEARAMLTELHALVAQGIDPRNARAAKIAENTQAITMQKLFDKIK